MFSLENKVAYLNNGKVMPLIGVGTWMAGETEHEVVEEAVFTALSHGYRHIDTALVYQNECAVGSAIQKWIKECGRKREEVFVVTKIPGSGLHPDRVEKFLNLSLKNLGLDYVDLFLIHTPVGYCGSVDDVFAIDGEGNFKIDYGTDLIVVWHEMEKLVDKGKALSIGVSNFNAKQIQKICAIARIPPVTNQVELHVECQEKELKRICDKSGIFLTSFASFGSPGREASQNSFVKVPRIPQLLTNPVVQLVSEKHERQPAQILLRFLVQQGIIVIPKSINPTRIKQNFEIWDFELDEVDMSALKFLDKGEKGRSFLFLTKFNNQYHPECPYPVIE